MIPGWPSFVEAAHPARAISRLQELLTCRTEDCLSERLSAYRQSGRRHMWASPLEADRNELHVFHNSVDMCHGAMAGLADIHRQIHDLVIEKLCQPRVLRYIHELASLDNLTSTERYAWLSLWGLYRPVLDHASITMLHQASA